SRASTSRSLPESLLRATRGPALATTRSSPATPRTSATAARSRPSPTAAPSPPRTGLPRSAALADLALPPASAPCFSSYVRCSTRFPGGFLDDRSVNLGSGNRVPAPEARMYVLRPGYGQLA